MRIKGLLIEFEFAGTIYGALSLALLAGAPLLKSAGMVRRGEGSDLGLNLYLLHCF